MATQIFNGDITLDVPHFSSVEHFVGDLLALLSGVDIEVIQGERLSSDDEQARLKTASAFIDGLDLWVTSREKLPLKLVWDKDPNGGVN